MNKYVALAHAAFIYTPCLHKQPKPANHTAAAARLCSGTTQ